MIFASQEGRLLHGSILSVDRAIEEARNVGLAVEAFVAVRAAGQATETWLAERSPFPAISISAPCLGAARNSALRITKGRTVAFLDGGDMWSRNFLVQASTRDQNNTRPVVWRPATSIGFADNYFDEERYSLQPVPNSTDMPASAILASNPYPPTFFARREILTTNSFPQEDAKRGWTAIDWWWNANLIGHGVELRAVPETLHYFRSSLAETRQRTHGTERLGPTTLELGKRRRE